MPRQLRLEYPGAVYHVVNRGDRREAHRQELLAPAAERIGAMNYEKVSVLSIDKFWSERGVIREPKHTWPTCGTGNRTSGVVNTKNRHLFGME